MALQHQTVIGELRLDRAGNASILFHLLVVDGLTEFSRENHRIAIIKDANLANKAAEINAILASIGRAPISAKDAQVVGATLTACWAAMNAP